MHNKKNSSYQARIRGSVNGDHGATATCISNPLRSGQSSGVSIVERLGDPANASSAAGKEGPGGGVSTSAAIGPRDRSGPDSVALGVEVPCVWTGKSAFRVVLYWMGCVVSLGILYVLSILYRKLYDSIVMVEVSPELATTVSIFVDGRWESGRVDIRSSGAYGSRVVVTEIKCRRYTARSAKAWRLFAVADVPAEFPQMVLDASRIVSGSGQSGPERHESMELLYGPNKMTLPEVDFCAIVVTQILHPFYLFQYFAVIVWVVQVILVS